MIDLIMHWIMSLRKEYDKKTNRILIKKYPQIGFLKRFKNQFLRDVAVVVGRNNSMESFQDFVGFYGAVINENPRVVHDLESDNKIEEKVNIIFEKIKKKNFSGIIIFNKCVWLAQRHELGDITKNYIRNKNITNGLSSTKIWNAYRIFSIIILIMWPTISLYLFVWALFDSESGVPIGELITAACSAWLICSMMPSAIARSSILMLHSENEPYASIISCEPYSHKKNIGAGTAIIIQNYHQKFWRSLWPVAYTERGFRARVRAYQAIKSYLNGE